MKCFKGFVRMLLLVACLFVSTTGKLLAQIERWKAGVLLTYDDFKGMAKPAGKTDAALTVSTMVFGFNSDGKRIQFEMYSAFDKSQSWFLPNSKTETVLMHEQAHFDITEWYIRLLRQKVASMQFKKGVEYSKVLSKIYKAIQRQCAQVQKRYDFETQHGLDDNMQGLWQAKVADALSELAAFDNESMIVVLE
jgi:hypothetical protein